MALRLASWLFFPLVGLALGLLTQPLPQAHARWATLEDAGAEYVFCNTQVQVNSDGTYTEVQEMSRKVLKESGRASVATFRMNYNANVSDFELLEAKTSNGSVVTPVNSKMIEDKPLASLGQGFDDHHQVMIAFPEVRVGSSVYIKYRLKVHEVALSKLFSMEFLYGATSPENPGTVTLDSSLPLYYRKSDPLGVLKVEQSQEKTKFRLKIELTRSIYRQVIEEPSGSLDPAQTTWVGVSTAESWPSVASELSPRYEKILNANLPPLFDEIRKEAEKLSGLEDQLNRITSRLAEKVNYLGDWRTLTGRYFPRALDEIAESRFGDCKDFSAVTTAILRKMGYSADVAFIYRGSGYRERTGALPQLGDFNHAIVHLSPSLKDREYWIDPTNFTSFAQGIFPDISDRPSLVLRSSGAQQSRTPAILPENYAERLKLRVDLDQSGSRTVSADYSASGAAAILMTGALLKTSSKNFDYNFISYFSDHNHLTQWKLGPYDLTSRVVSDYQIHFDFHESHSLMKTSAGPAYSLGDSPLLRPLMGKVKNSVSDLTLGQPRSFERVLHLRNVSRIGKAPLSCSISTEWFEVKRSVKENAEGIFVRDFTKIIRREIPNEKLKTSEYAQAQEALNGCFYAVSIIYRPRAKAKTIRSRALAEF